MPSNGELLDRIQTLNQLSGLEVTLRKEKNVNVFEFWQTDVPLGSSAGKRITGMHDSECRQIIKTCFTYAKAKVFAEGVRFGRRDSFGVPAGFTATVT